MADVIDGTLRVTGRLDIKLYDASGQLKDERQVDNLVVSAGKTWIAARMGATSLPNAMGYMALGTSQTTPGASDTTLGAQVGSAVALTSTTQTTNSVAYVCTFGSSVPSASANTYYEAGIFNASTSGTMLAHSVFTGITKQATDTMTITWTVTIN
jgi:hypothetical protein